MHGNFLWFQGCIVIYLCGGTKVFQILSHWYKVCVSVVIYAVFMWAGKWTSHIKKNIKWTIVLIVITVGDFQIGALWFCVIYLLKANGLSLSKLLIPVKFLELFNRKCLCIRYFVHPNLDKEITKMLDKKLNHHSFFVLHLWSLTSI